MTVNREIQAAKAGGISFHRIIAPLWPIGAVLTVAAFLLGMVVTVTNRKAAEVFQEVIYRKDWRNEFVFQTENDETLGAQQLSVTNASMDGVLLQSVDPDGSLRHVWAEGAEYTEQRAGSFSRGTCAWYGRTAGRHPSVSTATAGRG